MNLNENIAKFRTASGETQSQLADFLGVSNRTVSKWECGEGSPEVGTLMKIAEHYRLSLDELCGFRKEGDVRELPLAATVPQAFLKLYDTVDELRELFADADWTEMQNAAMTVPPHVFDREGTRYDVAVSEVSAGGTWAYAVSSPENNLAVSVFRNPENFAWLRDRADDLTSLFAWLTDGDILKLLYAVLSDALPHSFTAGYVEETLGIPAGKVREFLDFSRGVSREAELPGGMVTVYDWLEPTYMGMWLAFLSLGYEFLREGDRYGGFIRALYHPIIPDKEAEGGNCS